MGDLRQLLADLGLFDVSTYLQSGNAVFATAEGDDRGAPTLTSEIEKQIKRELGMPVTVLLRTPDDFARLVRHNPFLDQGAERSKLHVTFLASRPEPKLSTAIDPDAGGKDRFHLSDTDVYIWCPGGYGRSKLNNAFWENRLKVAATTRNWNTVQNLLKLASGEPQGPARGKKPQ